jgi:hypothetical protein
LGIKFPATMYMVAGSQAERAKDNKIYVMKMSQMHRNKDDENDDGWFALLRVDSFNRL